LIAVLFKGSVEDKEVRAIAATKHRYEPWLRRAVARPGPFIGAGLGILLLGVLTFLFVGREFMPTLDEQNLNLSSVRIPSTTIEKSVEMDLPIERALLTLPEVKTSIRRRVRPALPPIRCRPMPRTITSS
jgi:cobalt-zinc-cadmium resistance protein CzcA